jgi:hypothetical protein
VYQVLEILPATLRCTSGFPGSLRENFFLSWFRLSWSRPVPIASGLRAPGGNAGAKVRFATPGAAAHLLSDPLEDSDGLGGLVEQRTALIVGSMQAFVCAQPGP